MKKTLLLMSAMLLLSAGTFAQKQRTEVKGKLEKAITAIGNTQLAAAPAKMAPMREVQASPSVNKAPRRTMVDGVWYQRPEGSLYLSGRNDEQGAYWSYLYMPAFTNVTYKNMATKKENATWSLASSQTSISVDGNDDNDLEIELPKVTERYISPLYIPTLTQGKTSFRFGDDIYDYDNQNKPVPLNPDVALVNGDTINMLTQVNLAPGYFYGFSNGSSFGNRTATFTMEDGTEVEAISDAIYEFYKKPIKPLYITDIFFRVVNYSGAPLMKEGTEMKCTVRKVEEDGTIGEAIAEMPFTLADTTYCSSFTDESGIEHMSGAFLISQKETDAFGTEYDVPFVVKDEFVIVISGFEQEGVDFSLFMTSDLKDVAPADCFINDGLVTPTCRSYIRKDNGEPIGGLRYCQAITKEQSDQYNQEDGDNTDWTRHYNAVIFIDCMNDVVNIFDEFKTMWAYNEGGDVIAIVDEVNKETGKTETVAYGSVQYETTLPRLSTWSGYEGEENYQFEDVPDWIHITGHNDDYYYEDLENGSSYVTLTTMTADPLPEGVEGRKAVIRIVSERGAEDTFEVRQGTVYDFEPRDITDGKYYLLNTAAEKYWGAGNSWGTQASLVDNPEYVTLLKQPDGTYFLESQVSNGGTAYYFEGDYMDNGNAKALTLKQIDEEDGIAYFTIADPDGKYYGYDGQTTVLGKDVQEENNIIWAIISEKEMIDLMDKASVEDPIDATFYIADHNFGRNNRSYSAWVGEGFAKGGDNTNQCVESFHKDFSMTQTIENVKNGVYALTAQGFYRQDGENGNNLPYFFINGEKMTFPVKTGAENSMADASASFGKGLYTTDPIFVEVTDGKIELGAKLEGNAEIWAIWDNFQLTYYGDDANVKDVKNAVIVAQLQQLRDKVKEMIELPYMTDEAKTILNNALKATSAVNTAKEAAVKEAIETLKNAIAEAEALTKAAKLLYEGGMIPDNSLDGWTCTNTNTFHINTWSVEGNAGNDPSGMVTPFIENWVGAPGPLGEGQITYTLNNVPADTYSVTALIRVYSESGSEPTGATFFVGDTKADIAENGYSFTYNNMKGVYGTMGLSTTVGSDGVLKFGVDIAAPTFNWVAIKNVKIQAGIPEAIKNVDTKQTEENTIYNLNGQKVKSAQKGLYIVNGKKVVIK